MNPIGFNPFHSRTNQEKSESREHKTTAEIKPTIVQIFFPDRGRTLAYYNDRFDLHPGDIVFVDGKLAGLRGQVTAVSTHFKVKVEDYKRVIGLADTRVIGQFYQANAHLISFDPLALPWKQFCSWVKPPEEDGAEYYISYDEEGFPLDNLNGLEVDGAVAEHGLDYYRENRVLYLCLNGIQGRAIVEGTSPMRWNSSTGMGRSAICFATAPAAIPASTKWRCSSSSGKRWS